VYSKRDCGQIESYTEGLNQDIKESPNDNPDLLDKALGGKGSLIIIRQTRTKLYEIDGGAENMIPISRRAASGEGAPCGRGERRISCSWVPCRGAPPFRLGVGGMEGWRAGHELVPRLVEALAGKKVIMIGAAAGLVHTAVWNKAGEIFACGRGFYWQLGHGGTEHGSVPRLLAAPDFSKRISI